MAYIIADNIMSPLGTTAKENLQSVMAGQSALRLHKASELGVGHDYVSSVMEQVDAVASEQAPTHFERKVVASVKAALRQTKVDVSSARTLFVLSTTKGNIEALKTNTTTEQISLGGFAACLTQRMGFTTKPIVVCNACISGLAALILANRLVNKGVYDHVVVCGTDDIGRFVVSGFQSLNAMSAQACKPFDIERSGLNLGEAVATAIVSRETTSTQPFVWQLVQGVVRNDAYHISAPSKQADGQYACLQVLLKNAEASNIDFINVHGTATLFNDQMEGVALQRAELLAIPINGYKGYYGHTLGAAGLLETLLSMHAAEAGQVIGTRGFDELGVSAQVNISAQPRACLGQRFIKTISGFGGCNAAALFERVEVNAEGVAKPSVAAPSQPLLASLSLSQRLVLTPTQLIVNGVAQPTEGYEGMALLTHLYKTCVADYPKYYKMDALSRLGFLAAELLIKAAKAAGVADDAQRAVVFFNQHSSLAADCKYLESIVDADNYFPSPSAFVYTLPNIVTGEVAIRHGYHGETAFYVLPQYDESVMSQVLQATMADAQMHSMLAGWVDFEDEAHFKADIALYQVEK